jgi:hypothetical protein
LAATYLKLRTSILEVIEHLFGFPSAARKDRPPSGFYFWSQGISDDFTGNLSAQEPARVVPLVVRSIFSLPVDRSMGGDPALAASLYILLAIPEKK